MYPSELLAVLCAGAISRAEAFRRVQHACVAAARAVLGDGFALFASPMNPEAPDVDANDMALCRAMMTSPKRGDFHNWWRDQPGVLVHFVVVQSVDLPARQVTPAAAQAAGFLKAKPGDELFVELLSNRYEPLAATAALMAETPRGGFEREDAERIEVELARALFRLVTRQAESEFEVGSLGALLLAGGGFLRGIEIEHEQTRVMLESLSLEPASRAANIADEANVRLCLKYFGAETTTQLFRMGSSWREFQQWGGYATAPQQRLRVEALLRRVAQSGEGTALPIVEEMLDAVVLAPPDSSLAGWCISSLPQRLTGAVTVNVAGHCVEVVVTLAKVDAAIMRRGIGDVVVSMTQSGTREVADDDWHSFVISEDGKQARCDGRFGLGRLTERAWSLPAPSASDVAQIDEYITRWRGHIAARLRFCLEQNDHFIPSPFYFSHRYDEGPPNLLGAIEWLAKEGPPPPVAVKPFGEDAFARAAAMLEGLPCPRADRPGAQSIARLRIASTYTLELYGLACGDWLHRDTAMLLTDADGIEAAILWTDAHNPLYRTTLDGDVFAVRRFCEWLRGALLLRPELNGPHPISLDVDEEDERFDDDPTLMIELSAWLELGRPDLADRFVLDWRCDNHMARHGWTYPLRPGAQAAAKRAAETAMWRRFLEQVVDSGFGQYSPVEASGSGDD